MNRTANGLKRHSALIFTSIAVFGILGTTILGVLAGMKAQKRIDSLGELPENRKDRYLLIAKETWKCYVIVSLTALLSAGAAIMSHKVSAKDIARLATLATGSGAAFKTYRDKIKEVLGEEKEKEIFEKVKVEGPGIAYPRILDQEDEYYREFYVKYRLDFGVDEIPVVEFDSNPERVTAAFYCINRDFALGRIIDVALVKDFLGLPANDVDFKYFWIDTMFYEADMQPWIDFNEYFKEGEDEEGNTIHTICVEASPITDKELQKIEDGSYWDQWRA